MKTVKATHTEMYVFDNTRIGRKAANQIAKELKEKNGGDIYVNTSSAFGVISVTNRSRTDIEVDA